MAEYTPIQQRPDAVEVPLGAATVAIVQPNEYNGKRSIFVGQRGPKTGNHIKGGVASLTPAVLAAIDSFRPWLNEAETEAPVKAPRARRGTKRASS